MPTPTEPLGVPGEVVALAPLTAPPGVPGGLDVVAPVPGEHLDGTGVPAHVPGGGVQFVVMVLVHGGGVQFVVVVLVHGGGVVPEHPV
ncbi:MAG TPA: hypothetical protein VKR21_02405 [Solirubrobacteraceae bacterium]|nr:hypothetical protein [Solirubrobacteraceae bacterium]